MRMGLQALNIIMFPFIPVLMVIQEAYISSLSERLNPRHWLHKRTVLRHATAQMVQLDLGLEALYQLTGSNSTILTPQNE